MSSEALLLLPIEIRGEILFHEGFKNMTIHDKLQAHDLLRIDHSEGRAVVRVIPTDPLMLFVLVFLVGGDMPSINGRSGYAKISLNLWNPEKFDWHSGMDPCESRSIEDVKVENLGVKIKL